MKGLSFDSFGSFATHLLEVEVGLYETLHRGLEEVAEMVEHSAKDKLGEYQPQVGPFPAWAPLSDYTLYGWGWYPGKVDLGYAPPDNPLVREGDLRESIGHEVDHLDAVIGSPEDNALYQELGTSKMPPRPFLGPAGFENKEAIAKLVGAATVVGLVGGEFDLGALGYNFRTKDTVR